MFRAKKKAASKPNKSQPKANAPPPRKAADMSQDEAALVIQKQFRGYQARKEYGPLIVSGEKMSSEVAVFMKQYCRKWKAKSVFQVLLMYRAAKYQETIYMSQQVHLYNQNAVSALHVGNKERVSLNNIDPDTTPSQFLGRFVPRQWKLPFRLTDMPFCDSSYLCSTMGKRTLTKDDAPWDDPYKRRSRIITASGKSTDIGIGLPVEEGCDVFSFIQTPYTRDPNYIDVVYSGQPYRKGDHFFTTKSGKEREKMRSKGIAPPAPQFTPNYNFKANQSQSSSFGQNNGFGQSSGFGQNNGFGQSSGFGQNNSFGQSSGFGQNNGFGKSSGNGFDYSNSNNRNGEKASSPVRGYVPPAPNTNFVKPQYNSDNGNVNFRDKLKPVGANQRQNPIKELEAKFKQVSNNEDEEETQTFNFQGMLRKTNHNRASLRRSPETETTSNYGQGSFPSIPEQRTMSQSSYASNNNNVVYNSTARNKNVTPRPLLRQDSGDCRRNMSHHYKESARRAKADEVTTEIAPGIIIQGQEAEL